jgi:sterol desaturase/sphingolipid hydroxylase (fatty acid hydroxylase superfamily)
MNLQHINPTQLATPMFVILVVAEMLFLRFSGRGRYEPRDAAVSLIMGFGSVIFGVATGLVFAAFAHLISPYRLTTIAWSLPAAAICFVLDDLAYYAWHRCAHRMRWLWADHVVHHSSQHYNLGTALRQPWGGALTPAFIFKWPIILMGFPLEMIALVAGVNLVYQFWIHTETIGRMPRWFEAVFNSPSHHRVHHATNPRYLDANFAGVLIVWDRMFGSFVEEDAAEPPRYGIVKNLATFNPLRVASHEFVGIARDLAGARGPREIAGYLLGPPGWSPDGSRETSDDIKARWAAHQMARQPAE